MNRLKIVQQYMSLAVKYKRADLYNRAQKLHEKIIKKQDEKIAKKEM